MEVNSNFWWFGLRGCLYCGSLFPLSDGLCEVCSEELWSWVPEEELYEQELARFEKPLSVASLFAWVPGEQQVLSRLILSLKGSRQGHLWRHYAGEFLRRQLGSKCSSHSPMVLVPSPGRNGSEDHASLFTNALADASGAMVLRSLKRKEGALGPQKKKSKSQREQVGFEWAENFSAELCSDILRHRKVVFVDDIVTTGATAHAAWKKLGRPEEFTIWSLAQRTLSCGASMDLV